MMVIYTAQLSVEAVFQPKTQLVPVLAMSSFSVYETCLLAVRVNVT